MNFLLCQYRKFPEIKKQKYGPDEKYQWNESFKYETCKTKNLQRRSVILTIENDAIFWVIAITIASETKKHITGGLHLVMNIEIVLIKMSKTRSV